MSALRDDEDLALTLPLHGVQLIEASAGTGKTYTLAGLYLRLVVEEKMSVRDVLVVTFTKAATEKLRKELRTRLMLCAEAAANPDTAASSPAQAQSRHLVTAALARGEDAAALRVRLRLAALDLDSAQISTIHGFCQRSLAEHGAAATAQGELVANDKDLIATLAADVYREHATANDRDAYRAFAAVAGTPARFARLLPELLAATTAILPQPRRSAPQARAEMRAAHDSANATLARAWRAQGADAFECLLAHIDAGYINKGSYRIDKVREAREIFARCIETGGTTDVELLERYTSAAIESKHNTNKPLLKRQAFFDAVAQTRDLVRTAQDARRDFGLHLLHASIERARRQLAGIKQAARRHSYDDLVDALRRAVCDERGGAAFAAALRAQFPVALIDECQDTDAAQFAIFEKIWGQSGTLILIGDPKQSIYRFRGGDVDAYLAARRHAAGTATLKRNFRSSPAYLRALEYLYAFSAEAAFADARIEFEKVTAGGNVADGEVVVDGEPIAPLTFFTTEGISSKSEAMTRLASGCAAAILDLLLRARAGKATIVDETAHAPRAIATQDIAVLVHTNDEAYAMQTALSALHLPSVTVTRRSVFASNEAAELQLVLDALIEFDERRLRAALTTVLFGRTLEDFANPERLNWPRRLSEFANLRETWQRHGVLAMLEQAFERCAPDVLRLIDGERRMTNYLHLADLLQGASAQSLGQRGLVDWLSQRILRADDDSEDEQLRMESDAARVQIRTVHVAKGLEYPFVFLPFAALRPGARNSKPQLVRHHDADGNARHYWIADDAAAEHPDAQAALDAEKNEEQAERLRVLYVALTRARYASFVGIGIFGGGSAWPALLNLLRVEAGKAGETLLTRRLRLLFDTSAGTIQSSPLPERSEQRWSEEMPAVLGASRVATRPLPALRGSYSFSRLSAGAREDAQAQERGGANDEAASVSSTIAYVDIPSALRGPRFGTAFHEILERADFAEWRDWNELAPPSTQRELVARVLARHALARESAAEATITRLVAATLNEPLAFGARLADLAPRTKRAELPFHFAIGDAEASHWLDAMHAHRYLLGRTRFDTQRLRGLMTGVLDLVVLHDARWWVIDYKTNLLFANDGGSNPYSPEALASAVRDAEYDLQYLIYLVALHRWLKARVPGYDYARDVGGALYLFVRGLDGGGRSGVHENLPPPELIAELDAILAQKHEEAV